MNMHKLVAGVLLLGVCGGTLWADTPVKKKLPPLKSMGQNLAEKNQQQVSALQREVEDLQARYWANRVLNEKDVTLEDLKRFSQGWVGDGERQYRLIEAAVQTGHVTPLTPEEHRQLLEAQRQVNAALNPQMQNKKILSSLTQQECAELEARMWAYRAQHDRDPWYKPGWEDGLLLPEKYRLPSGDLVENLPRNIARKKEVRRLFLKYLKDKDLRPLSEKESARLSACQYFDEQVYSITRYPSYQFSGEGK